MQVNKKFYLTTLIHARQVYTMSIRDDDYDNANDDVMRSCERTRACTSCCITTVSNVSNELPR